MDKTDNKYVIYGHPTIVPGRRVPDSRMEKTHYHGYEHDPFSPPLRITTTGVSRFRAGDGFGGARRAAFSLNVITLGDAQYRQGSESGVLHVGDVFLAHRGANQNFRTGGAGFVHKRLVVTEWTVALETILRALKLDQCSVVRPTDTGAMIERFRRMHRVMREGRAGFPLELSRLLYETLLELGRSTVQDYPPAVRRIIDYMNRHLGEPLTLEAIARVARLSPRHLNRLFNRHVAASPGQFFQARRLDWARSLLVNTPLSIKEIALQTGFEDPLYFSARFRAFCGVSPREFRRSACT